MLAHSQCRVTKFIGGLHIAAKDVKDLGVVG